MVNARLLPFWRNKMKTKAQLFNQNDALQSAIQMAKQEDAPVGVWATIDGFFTWSIDHPIEDMQERKALSKKIAVVQPDGKVKVANIHVSRKGEV
jgi:hypothetical protein